MGTITDIRVDGKNKRRVKIFVDGCFSFTVDIEVSLTEGLKVGQCLTLDQIEKLKQADLLRGCYKVALRYLSYRPRSEAEVRQRLCRAGFDVDVVERVVTGLKERRLLDDLAFAQYWRDNRLSFKPRSQKLIKLELRQKGVAEETASEVVDDLDDEIMAYEAGLRKLRALANLNYIEFRHRLSGYLQRRGFSYETISSAVSRLWRERQS